jgi:hypothetical protein
LPFVLTVPLLLIRHRAGADAVGLGGGEILEVEIETTLLGLALERF